MAIEVRVSRGYAWRMIIIAVVCLVFGVWGVWDYVVAIPRDQKLSARLQLLQISKDALETEQSRSEFSMKAETAHTAVLAEMNSIIQREFGESVPQEAIRTAEEFRKAFKTLGEKMQNMKEPEWLALLATIRDGLVAERRLPLTEEEYPVAHAAFEQTVERIRLLGEVTEPGKYDRLTQWAFMLCLPCVPYYMWMFLAARRRVYRLDDEGTLHIPEGTWTQTQIAAAAWGSSFLPDFRPRPKPDLCLQEHGFLRLRTAG